MTTPVNRHPGGFPPGMPRRGPVGPSGQARARTGSDELADALRAARGLNAPRAPLTLCGTPPEDGTPVFRAGDPPVNRDVSAQPLRERLAERLICMGCLGLRFGPTHLAIRLLAGKH